MDKSDALLGDEEVVLHYNKRGAGVRPPNNDFGWANLPKSFMNQNTMFLLLTAMAANFYQKIVLLPLMCMFGVEATDRGKSFLFRFITVPAKWVRRQGRVCSISKNHTISSGLMDRKALSRAEKHRQ